FDRGQQRGVDPAVPLERQEQEVRAAVDAGRHRWSITTAGAATGDRCGSRGTPYRACSSWLSLGAELERFAHGKDLGRCLLGGALGGDLLGGEGQEALGQLGGAFPGGDDVVEDVGDLLVVEVRLRRHDAVVGHAVDVDGALQAPQHDVGDVGAAAFGLDELVDVVGERREGAGQALAVRLVAGHAGRVVDGLAGGGVGLTDGRSLGGDEGDGDDQSQNQRGEDL